MDAFEFNKIAAAILAPLLVIFASRTIVNELLTSHGPEKPGYEVVAAKPSVGADKGASVADSAAAKAGESAAAEVSTLQLLAKANADDGAKKGAKVAKKCTACHSFDKGGPNKVGPNLYNIVNRTVASTSGFAYSQSLKGKGGKWE